MASTESEISALVDSRSEAIRRKDLDRLVSFYAPDVRYFDVVPPLQYVGSDALRGRFTHWFDGWEGGIRQDVHDLEVLVSGDIAVTSMLIRSGGTLEGGQEVTLWVRATSTFHRSDGTWLITHEHVSLPADLQSGRAATDLTP